MAGNALTYLDPAGLATLTGAPTYHVWENKTYNVIDGKVFEVLTGAAHSMEDYESFVQWQNSLGRTIDSNLDVMIRRRLKAGQSIMMSYPADCEAEPDVADRIKAKIKLDELEAQSVGEPGPLESMIPFWGSGRSAIHAFQTGRWGMGLLHAGLAITDVFLVKSLLTAGGKAAISGATKTGLNATERWVFKGTQRQLEASIAKATRARASFDAAGGKFSLVDQILKTKLGKALGVFNWRGGKPLITVCRRGGYGTYLVS